jgi:pimeloyl-ACP methyl ester carboxylesterase
MLRVKVSLALVEMANAVGGSMGGHETLLLLGQYPKLLAGAVAFDSVTNFYRR